MNWIPHLYTPIHFSFVKHIRCTLSLLFIVTWYALSTLALYCLCLIHTDNDPSKLVVTCIDICKIYDDVAVSYSTYNWRLLDMHWILIIAQLIWLCFNHGLLTWVQYTYVHACAQCAFRQMQYASNFWHVIFACFKSEDITVTYLLSVSTWH